MNTTCPTCGAAADGRFCSTCGSALAGATCANCGTALTSGARFCHRCGTPAGAAATPSRDVASVIPWGVAAIALLSLVALVVGQRMGARNTSPPDASSNSAASAPFAGDAPSGPVPQTPDISAMSPTERAERLYDRVMREAQAGHMENARTFMPMAIAAFGMLGPLTVDQRFDLGRLGEVSGEAALVRAQADTILRERPTHLLGLILAAKAAHMEKQDTRAREFGARLLSAEPAERSAKLPEYLLHKAEIDSALAAARSLKN